MTAAGPLVFPPSRVLAGWWPHLAPIHPQAIGVAHLLLHRVEAPVWVSRPHALDRFAQLVLHALTLGSEPTVPAVESRLHLGIQVVRQLLHRLQKEGLVQVGPAGRWLPTALGRYALDRGEYSAVTHERRSFLFVDAGPGREPQFLDLRDAPCTPWAAPEGWSFDVSVLQACVRQPAEWKQRRGFPPDVVGVLDLGRSEADPGLEVRPAAESPHAGGEDQATDLHFPTPVPGPPNWQRVILDRPQHLLAALVRAAEGPSGDRLLGFPVRPDVWTLQADCPAFTIDTHWQEIFPELGEEPPAEAWRQAWQTWCQSRRLPPAEVEACTIQRQGLRLRVVVDQRLLDRLRATRSEVLRGEAWILAGSERVRHAAAVEVVENK